MPTKRNIQWEWEDRSPEEWEAILAETTVEISPSDLKYIRTKLEELKDDGNKTGYYLWQSRGALHGIFHRLGITEIENERRIT